MESLKPLLLFVVLGGVGYAVYVALNQAPSPEASSRPPNWNKPPQAGAKTGRNRNVAAAPRSQTPIVSTSAPAVSHPSAISSLPFGIGKSASQSAAQPPAPPPLAKVEPNPPSMPAAPADRYAPAPTTAPVAAAEPPAATPAATAEAYAATPPPMGDRYSRSSAAMEVNPPAAADQAAATPPAGAATAEAQHARDDFASTMRYAQSLLGSGKLVEALRELSKWYDHPALSPADQNQLVETLGQLAGTVIYSPDPWLGPPYVVQPGDTLQTIADGCQVPWQLLAKINGIQNPAQLTPGSQLKVVRGPFHAQLNLQQQWLALFVDGMYAGRFAVQGARETVKPDGTYPVAKFAPDNPANVAHRPYVSLGGDLHLCVPDDAGTAGVAAVRMNERDMSDVFDMLSERSQVTVRR